MKEYIIQFFNNNNIEIDSNNLDIKHEIECILNNYTK